MKSSLLLSVIATVLLGACANSSRWREREIVIPSHDSVVKDQSPAEGERKIPVIQQY